MTRLAFAAAVNAACQRSWRFVLLAACVEAVLHGLYVLAAAGLIWLAGVYAMVTFKREAERRIDREMTRVRARMTHAYDQAQARARDEGAL